MMRAQRVIERVLVTTSMLVAACGGTSRSPAGSHSGDGAPECGTRSVAAGADAAAAVSLGGFIIGHIDYDGYPRRPMECSADSSCPAGLRCFHLTAEVGICDAPSPPSVDQCPPEDRLDTPPF
jgi:hypothetical protein